MTDAMKPLIYAASEGPLSRAQAEMAFEELRAPYDWREMSEPQNDAPKRWHPLEDEE